MADEEGFDIVSDLPVFFAETVLDLFLGAINHDGNLWPSRKGVDKGVENVLVSLPWFKLGGREGGVLLLVPALHTTSTLKDYGEMSLDEYVTCITIYVMLWRPLVSSTQIIQFMCLLFTKCLFQESTKRLMSFVKPLITTKYAQRETGHCTKCGQMACSILTIHYHMDC